MINLILVGGSCFVVGLLAGAGLVLQSWADSNEVLYWQLLHRQ